MLTSEASTAMTSLRFTIVSLLPTDAMVRQSIEQAGDRRRRQSWCDEGQTETENE